MQKKWNIKEKSKNSSSFSLAEKHNRLVLKLLSERGIESAEEIERFFVFDYVAISDPLKIVGIEKAVERVRLAKERNEKVAVFGDYDADGVTATALMIETLENLGFTDLSHYIPDRQLEGYGMNDGAIDFLEAYFDGRANCTLMSLKWRGPKKKGWM